MENYKTNLLDLRRLDCMELMRNTPDKHYALAIVDPPYGIGEDGGKFRDRKGGGHRVLEKKNWDSSAPTVEYFIELKRVSQNQIIWGANHLCCLFKANSAGWVYWNKMMGGDFSDGELAYTSFDRPLKSFSFCNKYSGKQHPTEKPVALYRWLLVNYAKEGDTILDTHMGSGSIAIACHYAGYRLTACELDQDYFDSAIDRIKRETAQLTLAI